MVPKGDKVTPPVGVTIVKAKAAEIRAFCQHGATSDIISSPKKIWL
jgi:hypothetical protein